MNTHTFCVKADYFFSLPFIGRPLMVKMLFTIFLGIQEETQWKRPKFTKAATTCLYQEELLDTEPIG